MGCSLSLSLFLRKCPAVKNTHEHTHTKTRRQRVYTRTLHLCSPARGVFESKSRIHIFFFCFPLFFFFTEKRKEIKIIKYEFCLRKLFLRPDEFVTPPPPLRAVEAVGSSSHGLCAGDERNAFKCAL